MCVACRAEADPQMTVGAAVVLGMMIADLQHAGRRKYEGSLCDHHASFVPLGAEKTPSRDDRACAGE